MSKVVILVGSKGMNVKLADKLAEEISSQKGTYKLINLVDLELPLYPAKSAEATAKIISLTEEISSSAALLIVAPEYNGSVPPALNNAIAWVSTSSEDWRQAFNGKTVALATHSGGGGAHVLMAMRQQFSYLGANVIGRDILTHYKKELNPDSAAEVIQQLLKHGQA
jgi:chromate reductase, NAD(P)H dehydrogenase (quinone)